MPPANDLPNVQDLVFSVVGVARRDLVYVVAHPRDEAAAEDDGTPLTYLLQRTDEDWDVLPIDWPAPILAIQHDPAVVHAIGIGGEVLRLAGDDVSGEYIARGNDGPSGMGWLRGARAIGRHVFAVGMSRQAYVRDDAGWRTIDRAVRERGPAIGLEAVDGTSERDVYAVGLGGDIVRYDGSDLRKLQSPTASTLRDVRAVDRARCFACGTGGVLLRGAGDRFEVVDHRSTKANLYALEWFGGRLYVASLKTVYRLEGDALLPVDLGVPDLTAGSLHASEGRLWSCGARHLAFTEDGARWTRVDVAF
jgi:hypothetical protein